MMNSPKISVIVPVYKTEKYLEKCISSIVNQNYKNLEIILVDDGSPDNCPKICDEWAKKDSRIIVIHKNNGGLADARNAALEIYTGDYVVFIDSDDWVDSDYVSFLYSKINDSKADVVCCDFYFEFLDRETEIIETESHTFVSNVLISFLYDEIRPEVCSKMYSRRIIGDLRVNVDNKYAEDVPFNYYICKKCSKLVNTGIPKYHYLQNSGNSLTTPYLSYARVESYKLYLQIISECKNNEKIYDAAIWRFTRGTLAILSRVMLVPEYCEKYYDEIAENISCYKSDIIRNRKVSMRDKIIVIALSVNRKLFKNVVLSIRRV